MEITLNKYTGEAYLNLLRQTLMCRIPVTRPVAFRVGSSNVIDLGDLAEEDTSEFISNVSSSSFVMQGEKELCIVSQGPFGPAEHLFPNRSSIILLVHSVFPPNLRQLLF